MNSATDVVAPGESYVIFSVRCGMLEAAMKILCEKPPMLHTVDLSLSSDGWKIGAVFFKENSHDVRARVVLMEGQKVFFDPPVWG